MTVSLIGDLIPGETNNEDRDKSICPAKINAGRNKKTKDIHFFIGKKKI